jgi:hypothetical protein
MPEARYALAHAALVCARAAKSREVVEALERADLTPLLPPPGHHEPCWDVSPAGIGALLGYEPS